MSTPEMDLYVCVPVNVYCLRAWLHTTVVERIPQRQKQIFQRNL